MWEYWNLENNHILPKKSYLQKQDPICCIGIRIRWYGAIMLGNKQSLSWLHFTYYDSWICEEQSAQSGCLISGALIIPRSYWDLDYSQSPTGKNPHWWHAFKHSRPLKGCGHSNYAQKKDQWGARSQFQQSRQILWSSWRSPSELLIHSVLTGSYLQPKLRKWNCMWGKNLIPLGSDSNINKRKWNTCGIMTRSFIWLPLFPSRPYTRKLKFLPAGGWLWIFAANCFFWLSFCVMPFLTSHINV